VLRDAMLHSSKNNTKVLSRPIWWRPETTQPTVPQVTDLTFNAKKKLDYF
jgi:hypothetical protein